MNFGAVLEAGNGAWAILALWLSIFMFYHVAAVWMQRGISWRRLITGLPLSMQVAVGTLVVAVAVCETRGALWWSRYQHNGDLDPLMPESWLYLSGTALGIVGFLCILRAVSQPIFGQWPWVAALCSTAAYLALWGSKFV